MAIFMARDPRVGKAHTLTDVVVMLSDVFGDHVRKRENKELFSAAMFQVIWSLREMVALDEVEARLVRGGQT